MGFRNKYTILSLVLIGVFGTAQAEDLRSKISQMEKEIQVQESSIESSRKNLTEMTKEIEKIKKSNGSRIVSKILLQKKMREAQVVSKNIESSIKKLTVMTVDLQKQRSLLMNEIDGQIKQLTANKETHQLAQLQQLQQLIAEKDSLLAHQNKVMNVPNFKLSSIGNEREDLVEKLQVVEDLQKSMIQKIAFLKNELSEERSREFLRNEVSHFIDEENFFGEQSFISSGLNRRETARNPAATALKKDATSNNTTNPTTTDPSATPDPASNPDTTTPDASANVDAPDNAAETSDVSTMAMQPTTSDSTSFQQPQEIARFETLLDQVQESIRETNPKSTGKKSDVVSSLRTRDRKMTHKSKRGILEQNLALSQKILSDLDILRQNLSQQIHSLD